jgi:hypothetical protein
MALAAGAAVRVIARATARATLVLMTPNGELSASVNGLEPPLKGEAKSMLSEDHKQAPRVRALLQAVHDERAKTGFAGFGSARIGMEVTMRPVGGLAGDVTNALGGIGDTLQTNRVNVDLTYLGELADAFIYTDDKQIREIRYREEPGPLGYTVRFWLL